MIEGLESLLAYIPEPLRTILLGFVVLAGGWTFWKRFQGENSSVVAEASSTALETVLKAVEFAEKRIKALEDEVSRIPELEREYAKLQLDNVRLQTRNEELISHIVRLEATILKGRLAAGDLAVAYG